MNNDVNKTYVKFLPVLTIKFSTSLLKLNFGDCFSLLLMAQKLKKLLIIPNQFTLASLLSYSAKCGVYGHEPFQSYVQGKYKLR